MSANSSTDHTPFRNGQLVSASGSGVARTNSITERRALIRNTLLATSRTIQAPNFLRASAHDLRLLFDLYDSHFFNGVLRQRLPGPCALGFSGRLRASGGMTYRSRRGGVCSYRIAISTGLLFDNFREPGATHVVAGVVCTDRLDALMRIMEHEMLHLYEYLVFGRSNCAAKRFQAMARELFGHTAHRHSLPTARQRTLKQTTLRPGSAVTFVHEGRRLRGMVNRITRRATVLVEDPRGTRYTDGKRYLKFYVPLSELTAEPSPATT